MQNICKYILYIIYIYLRDIKERGQKKWTAIKKESEYNKNILHAFIKI